MKLSFTFFMRVYSLFAFLFFLFGAFAVVVGGPPLLTGYEWGDASIVFGTRVFRIIVIFFFGTGFIVSSFLFFVMRRRGFTAYKRIIERISSERSTNFNLNIQFPESDELGNLGKWLNRFIEAVRDFDRIKVERLRTSQQKITALSENMEKGVMLLTGENKISYINAQAVKLLNIGEKTVVGLPIERVVENEQLDEALEEIKKKPKNRTLADLRVKSGEAVYKAKLTVIPIISSELKVMESMIIFDYISKKVLNI
jgi:signal transduction histidine kinase